MRKMDAKQKLKMFERFSMEPHEEMCKIMEILQRTVEITRIKETISEFDKARENGDVIEDIICHSIGSDELGTYQELSIKLRHKQEVG